jgi:amidohydrolase
MIKLEDIKMYESYIIQKRRDFHQHPEPGFNEFRTSKIIEEELIRFGFDVTTGIGVTGVIGVLHGSQKGKTIALRADIDALCMQEENESEYKSTIDGMMHSCGHDTHTAMLLGVAKYFSDNTDTLNGTLKLIFQSAEEGPMPGGGISVVNGGYLDDCDAVFGLHIVTKLPVGKISIKKGPAMAAPDEFNIKIIGTGTHASAPHTGQDPILIASQVVQALQNIVSRNISPTDSAVISVCTINGGTAFNIIPESVNMSGTIRTLNNDTRNFIFKRIDETVKHITQMNNANYELEIIEAYPPLINDPDMSEFVLQTGYDLLGKANVLTLTEPSMGGEDFSYYLQKKPGAYFWLGGMKPGSDKVYYNHNPKFDPDESAFLIGTAMHINIVLNYLKK